MSFVPEVVGLALRSSWRWG